MSDYTIETIELTETARLRIVSDLDPTNPRKDWDMLTGFVKIDGRGDSRLIDVEPVHDEPIPIAEAQSRIERESDVERWARIFHGLHIEYDSEHGGYWFVDPSAFHQNFPAVPGGGKVARIRPARVDGIFQANVYETYEQDALECQAEVIEAERETYRQWADGEVYGVILERLALWAKLSDDGSSVLQGDGTVREEWEEVESLWGCYLDDDYTAQVVAAEHFTLSDEETAALGLPERQRPETPSEPATGVSGEW